MSTTYDIDTRATDALIAIKARIDGEWDNPQLMRFGALDIEPLIDIKRFADETLLDIQVKTP